MSSTLHSFFYLKSKWRLLVILSTGFGVIDFRKSICSGTEGRGYPRFEMHRSGVEFLEVMRFAVVQISAGVVHSPPSSKELLD